MGSSCSACTSSQGEKKIEIFDEEEAKRLEGEEFDLKLYCPKIIRKIQARFRGRKIRA